MEITVLYLKIHGINCRFHGRKYPFTQFATIISPTDAVTFSNTIQLSPNWLAWNQDNVSEWGDMSIRGLVQRVMSMKI